ncbi:uncharacterized protein [Physcomitrium patens]|uniref:uncharacterized protein isoform X1 n=1 Tax=Physcomitrium patens TaxID=3218 RepID=UPI003CCE1C56
MIFFSAKCFQVDLTSSGPAIPRVFVGFKGSDLKLNHTFSVNPMPVNHLSIISRKSRLESTFCYRLSDADYVIALESQYTDCGSLPVEQLLHNLHSEIIHGEEAVVMVFKRICICGFCRIVINGESWRVDMRQNGLLRA